MLLSDSGPDRPTPPSSATIRRLLDRFLMTDADLESFCLDYFPEVQRRFCAGMERKQKVNLLLAIASPIDLVTRLELDSSDSRRSQLGDLGMTAPPAAASRSVSSWYVAILVSSVVGMAITFGLLNLRQHVARLAQTVPTDRLDFSGQSSSPASSETIPLLNSQPSSAFVVDVLSGRILGATPWSPRGPVQSWPQRICLRHEGFLPAEINLAALRENKPTPLVYLERAAGDTRQLARETERCAQTPIID